MEKSKIEKIEILDSIIIGRVEPYIYAFTTNTIPNYLKIGDTYRPISIRFNEWRRSFPNLEEKYQRKAIVNNEVYFRDFSVHQFLESDLHKERLKPSDIDEDTYYSKEFFKNTSVQNIDEAIDDIKKNHKKNTGKYEYYSVNDKMPKLFHYERGEEWSLRPNQKETVSCFLKAVKNGRTNLLMYAVMRFGKSFTSLCCALEIGAKLVLVVSAKADVKDEWKKTVESAGNFKEYVFLEAFDLSSNKKAIATNQAENKKIVLFLTLQDLQGDLIKEKHKELLNEQVDLLIVDETHFGARANSFGAILKEAGYDKNDKKNIIKLNDESVELNDADKQIKKINAKIKLHLSGTPYRILMGSEFDKEDIISFVQFSDIIKEKENWDNENLNSDDINEWDNPYYGIPQMIRFAFNPSKLARDKMEELKKSGVSFAFSKLFEPCSIKKDIKNENHKKFQNEAEVLDLIKVIDGSKEDDDLLGFLDYDKIKTGKMCRHIVMVLPYCASCDAMEELLNKKCDTFKNIREYEIINISGVEGAINYKSANDIKNKIKECENNNQKTLTLTVNRMLTGSTVEQWDTMLYFKDTSSPQEYDQSIFRLQNQYTRILSGESGIIKENLKPQTLLVDFDPDRLFKMQEQKSLIYNVNIEENGNSRLRERIEEELRISPVIMMNHKKIKQVEAINILEAISQYNNKKSISDEIEELPIDFTILKDIEVRKIIEQQAEFNSKQGMILTPSTEDGDDYELENINPDKLDSKNKKDTHNESKDENELKRLEKKIKTYYQRILFFSFLTRDKVSSLDDILEVLNKESNLRLIKNLCVDEAILIKLAKNMDPFKRNSLDYKIQNISKLANDNSIKPIERAMTSINKFNRMSQSEIITPATVCDKMVDLIPEEELKKIIERKDKILDIASKSGEYAVSLYRKLVDKIGFSHDEIKDSIYSVPTSSIAYEFTRKFYEILNLNTDNIACEFNSYDLIKIKLNEDIEYSRIVNLLTQKKQFNRIKLNEDIEESDVNVKFGAIVGNPPYQEEIKGSSDRQIYNEFMELAYSMSKIAVFITPGKFLFNAGKTPKKWNEKMLNDPYLQLAHYEPNASDIFPNIALATSIVITVRNSERKNKPIGKFFPNENMKNIVNKVCSQNDFIPLSNIIYLQSKFNLETLYEEYPSYRDILKTERRLITSIFSKKLDVFTEVKITDEMIKIWGNGEDGKLTTRYIDKKYLDNSQVNVSGFKVILSATNGGAGNIGNNPVNIIGEPKVLEANSGFTQTFISIGNYKTLDEAENLLKYLKTRFARFMIGTLKATQRLNKEVFENIPMQDFSKSSNIDWKSSLNEIDEKLFEKYDLTIDEKIYIKKTIKEM